MNGNGRADMHAQGAGSSAAAEADRQNRGPRVGGPWIGALALAALLSGAMTGGSAWLALDEMNARARGQAARSLDEALDLMRVAELAAGLSSSAVELETATTTQHRLAAHNALRQRTQQLGTMLDALPRDRRAELRVPALAIRAEVDELNAAVERRLAARDGLQDLTGQVAGRSEALAAALAPPHAPSPDGELLRRIDGARQAVALRLLTAGMAPAAAPAVHGDFREAAATLFDALDDLPIDPASPRRADAARQLVALGMDRQNIFELRQEKEALAAKAAGIATLLRGTASDLAHRAGLGALALRDGLRNGPRDELRDEPRNGSLIDRVGAEMTAAAPVGVGLVTGLAVFAVGLGATRSRARRPAPTDPHTATAQAGAPPETLPLRILLAEDEPVSQRAAAALLRRAGHDVTVADDGRAALAAVERDRYDLVLMDMQMPGMDGVEATRRIRALPDGSGTGAAGLRIVVLTASAVPGAAERCRAAGADAVLEKPLRLPTLAALMDRLSAGTASAVDDAPPPPDRPSALPVFDEPVFDEEAIRQMREHLPAERVAALVTNTLVTLRGYQAALEQAWNAGDRATAAAMAHKIAGVAGIYGCTALRGAARSLERALEAGEGETGGDDPETLFRALDAAVPPALAALDRWSDGG